jgi:hypothetical protein
MGLDKSALRQLLGLGRRPRIPGTLARLWGLTVGQPGGRSYLQTTKCRK